MRPMPGQLLDRLVRPDVRVFGRLRSAFQVCGYSGLALAILLAMTLVLRRGLSPLVMACVVLSAVASFFALAMATKILTGRENLVYYYHEFAALAFAAVFLWLSQQPVLEYLDATILGIGAFLACGRIGCLMVGCCHGRPCGWGVRYRPEHAAAGFPGYLMGVRLFPVQLVESAWVLGVVALGSYLVLIGEPPGAALARYVVMYDLGRFSLEFLRGDTVRRYHYGFSEAQWISVLLMVAVAAGELGGLLPLQAWDIAATVGVILVMIGVAVGRRKLTTYQILQPHHVREVAEALGRASTDGGTGERDGSSDDIRLFLTSLGYRISTGVVAVGPERVRHYGLSSVDRRITRETAQALADLIILLEQTPCRSQIVEGRRGVFHLLVRAAA